MAGLAKKQELFQPLTGVALNRQSLERLKQIFDLRANELRRRPQGISVLAQFSFVLVDSCFNFLCFSKLAALE